MLKRLLIGLGVCVFLMLTLFVYFRVGWDRAVAHCSYGPVAQTFDQVEHSWSWNPPGFTCSYIGGRRDGDVETSLWF